MAVTSCLSNYTLKGVGFDCNPNLAGVKHVYITYYDDMEVPATAVTETAHTISNIVLTHDAKWYTYEFARNTSSLNSTLTKDDANGTRYYTNTLTLVFNKLTAQKHLEAMALASEKLAVLVEDYNNHIWFLGYDAYVSGTAEEVGTGTSADDRNGYSVTIEGTSAFLPWEFVGTFEPEDAPTEG